MLELKLYFSGEDSKAFAEMLNANRNRPVEFKQVHEADKKRDRFTISCKSEREIFNLGFLWKSKIQPHEEEAPF